jgi:ubiquinone/menaquinone biosynthesis C-methylase UbiE
MLRDRMHTMWDSVAPAWELHSDYVDARGARLAKAMLDRAGLAPDARVLELACGGGGLGIAAAPRVAPGGEVVLSDVAPEMVAIAARRAGERGVTNVATRVLDIEAIAEPDASYDVVLCREGLMFAAEHARAAGEIARVLRPGGRVVVAVWGPRAENPWLGIVLDTVGEHLGMPVPPPGIPGPFALDDRDVLGEILRAAGLRDVTIDQVSVPMHARSFDDWWTRTSALAGPIASLLAGLNDDSKAELRARLQARVRPFAAADGLHFPGVSLLGTGQRP